MSDGGSLQNLNDIVVPGPVAWFPPAPGWYVVFFILLCLLAWVSVGQWRKWCRNRYRREALRELSAIRAQSSSDRVRELPVLLKRAALSVWPRELVASLSGDAWHQFLDETGGRQQFFGSAGKTLEQLAYSERNAPLPQDTDVVKLMSAAEFWLKHHRFRPGSA